MCKKWKSNENMGMLYLVWLQSFHILSNNCKFKFILHFTSHCLKEYDWYRLRYWYEKNCLVEFLFCFCYCGIPMWNWKSTIKYVVYLYFLVKTTRLEWDELPFHHWTITTRSLQRANCFIQDLVKKIYLGLGVLRHIKPCVPHNALLAVYDPMFCHTALQCSE